MTASPARDPVPATLPEAVLTAGQGVVDRVDLGPISERLAALPTAALLSDLDAILAGISTSDAQGSARRAGLIGRLLGRDLVAQADPDPPEQRVRVHLLVANEHAATLQGELHWLAAASTALRVEIAALSVAIDEARTRLASMAEVPAAVLDPGLRRIRYLEAIAASWTQAQAQVCLALEHGRLLVSRFEHARDLLVPLWRQHAAARALSGALAAPEAQRLASLHRQAVDAVASLHAVPHSTDPIIPPTRQTRNPRHDRAHD